MWRRNSLQKLIARMEKDGSFASEEAAWILARTDAGVDALVAATRHPEGFVRSAAAFALGGRNRPGHRRGPPGSSPNGRRSPCIGSVL